MKRHLSFNGIIFMAIFINACLCQSNLYPLVLVPGSGGNQLEVRLTEKYRPSSLFCRFRARESAGWYRIWFDPSVIVPPFTKCFAERMKLCYDPISDDYQNALGVESRVPYFGSTQGLLYLDPDLKHITSYMAPLVKSMEGLGYTDGVNLFGAPYDFRYGLAAEGHSCKVGTKFLRDLKNLIEEASKTNKDKPVIIITHSLGALFVLHLLNQSPLSWRRQFIKHFIALSPPWAGTVQEMITFASGYTLGVPLVNPLLVREEQRSSESNLWLLPWPNIFGLEPLVFTPNKNYSAHEISQFLHDIGFSDGVYPYESRILPLTEKIEAPLIPVTCIIGTGIETPESLFYGKEGFDIQPKIVYGDGDGTVNLRSLIATEEAWKNETEQVLNMIKIPGVSHTSVLKDEAALRKIVEEVSAINSPVLSSLLELNQRSLDPKQIACN